MTARLYSPLKSVFPWMVAVGLPEGVASGAGVPAAGAPAAGAPPLAPSPPPVGGGGVGALSLSQEQMPTIRRATAAISMNDLIVLSSQG
jgi:hypothetical protein